MKIRPVIVLALTLTAAGVAAPPRPSTPHVVFVVGEGEYRSEWSMPALADLLLLAGAICWLLRVWQVAGSQPDGAPRAAVAAAAAAVSKART